MCSSCLNPLFRSNNKAWLKSLDPMSGIFKSDTLSEGSKPWSPSFIHDLSKKSLIIPAFLPFILFFHYKLWVIVNLKRILTWKIRVDFVLWAQQMERIIKTESLSSSSSSMWFSWSGVTNCDKPFVKKASLWKFLRSRSSTHHQVNPRESLRILG